MNEYRRGNGIGVYRSCIILLLLIMALTPSAVAADTMFRANPQHTGVYDNGGIVPTNTELWRFKTGDMVDSSPAVSNGVVYVGSVDNNLYAIDAVNGTEKWRFKTGGSVAYSSPAVSNGVVYVGSSDNNLYAIDAVTGKEKWRLELENWGASSPAVSNGVVYIGGPSNYMSAIDAVTGKEKWRFEMGNVVYSSPAVSNGVVYVGSRDGKLYAIDAVTGKKNWRFGTGDVVFSSPGVSNGVVYVGSDDNNLYAIDAVTGTEKWRFKTGGSVHSSPAVSNGVVYVGSWDKNLYAIGGASTGQVNTQTTISTQSVSTNGAAATTVASTQNIRNTPSFVSSSDNGSFNASLLIIVILGLLILAGGGYVIYRMKRKPSGDQPHKSMLNRIASVDERSSALSQFRSPVQALIAKARDQYRSGAYDAVRATLKSAENAITSLALGETRLKQWKKDGYTTTAIESLKTDNVDIINTAFRDFEKDLVTLKQYERRVQELKRSYSMGNIDLSITQRIGSIESQLHDPRNIPDIKRELEAIEQILHDQQERSKQQQDTEQLFTRLHVKAEKLTRYASLVTGSFTEAKDQNTAKKNNDARKTLRTIEDTIDTLLECESSLALWKTKGYNTIELETLQPENTDEVISAFRQYNQTIQRLETIAQELEAKKSAYPDLREQPETADCIRSIEQNLKNPEEIDTVEKDYHQLNNSIRQLEDKKRTIEQQIRDQAEKVQREASSPAIKREIEPIKKYIRQHDIPRAQELLQDLSRQQLLQVNAAIAALRTDCAVVSLSSDAIREQIAVEHYGDAILDAENAIAELNRIQESYAKAKVLRPTVTEPAFIALFENGKYGEFIRASEERQRFIKKVTELKEKGRKLLVEAEQFGMVPEHVHSKLDADDIPTIESAISELETFSITAKPELTLALDHTQLIADDWDRMTIQLANRGDAHAKDVRLKFSDEFDTKRIKPATINAGATTSLDIGIRPKVKGKIPLEVTAMYHRDGNYKEYRETYEFWIEVVEKGTTATSGTPISQVGQFTPKSITFQQPQITRAYEFYAGYIRLKISVKNPTHLTIHDVILEPDIDRAILYLERHEPEEYTSENEKIILGTINPKNDRTISLYLEPITCAKEGTDVHCHIRYKDAQGHPGSLDMEPVKIQIVCPIFETIEPVNIGMLKQLIESLSSRDTKVFSVPRNLDAPTQLKIFQSVIQLHDIRHISTLRRANNIESWYYGRTKVSQKDMVIKLGIVKDKDMVVITAYSDDPKDLTGLLAEISRHISEELSKWGNVQKIINVTIKDSVVQRTNLLSFCNAEGICSGNVTIEGSVVMRTNILSSDHENPDL